MATPNEISQFYRCKEVVVELNLRLDANSSEFKLKDAKGVSLGGFGDTKDLYYFLCGYQAGFSDGKWSNV